MCVSYTDINYYMNTDVTMYDLNKVNHNLQRRREGFQGTAALLCYELTRARIIVYSSLIWTVGFLFNRENHDTLWLPNKKIQRKVTSIIEFVINVI